MTGFSRPPIATTPTVKDDTVESIVDAWLTPDPEYAAVNLGPLKPLARPFFLRLMDGIDTSEFPWGTRAADYARTKIGMGENLISFDPPGDDCAAGSIPDWWKDTFFNTTKVDPEACPAKDGFSNYVKYRNGWNPLIFYSGSACALTIVSGGNQRGDPSTWLRDPLIVRMHGANPASKVTFSVIHGGALLASATGQQPTATLQERCPSDTFVFILLPDHSGRNVIEISAPTVDGTAVLCTTAVAVQANMPPPTGLNVVALSATSYAMSWTPRDKSKRTTIQFSVDHGATWQTLASVDSGVIRATAVGFQPGQNPRFRLFTGGPHFAPKLPSSAPHLISPTTTVPSAVTPPPATPYLIAPYNIWLGDYAHPRPSTRSSHKTVLP